MANNMNTTNANTEMPAWAARVVRVVLLSAGAGLIVSGAGLPLGIFLVIAGLAGWGSVTALPGAAKRK